MHRCITCLIRSIDFSTSFKGYQKSAQFICNNYLSQFQTQLTHKTQLIQKMRESKELNEFAKFT